MRVNDYHAQIFFKDREDLAIMIGRLLGCHNGHDFYVSATHLSLRYNIADQACVDKVTDVAWLDSLENKNSTRSW